MDRAFSGEEGENQTRRHERIKGKRGGSVEGLEERLDILYEMSELR